MVSLSETSFPIPQKKESKARKLFRKPWMMALTAAALALTAYLLYHTLSRYSFDEIVASVRAIPFHRLALAGAFAAASYVCLTGFDWLAIRSIGRKVPYRKVALASFISLSLGHSIGFAGVSSGAIRYRFYSRWGLSAGDVAKVVLFCGVMVGLGLTLLGGLALLLQPDLAEGVTKLQRPVILTVGIACVAIVTAWLALPFFVHRPIGFRKWSVDVPPFRLALGQVVVGAVNFSLVAACLHQTILAVAEVDYLSVAAVYVIANATTMITHVPGGLGVIESVVMYLLPGANLIGSVLVFRFIYFLVPLALGSLTFAVTELVFRRLDAKRKR
ncbi:lysylphosphatidylglycerol synthase domain-containing protein [Microvirga pudoricolor]|uniref:lysylphosphatidylglycerol synthase domain-containing protein n=1 Tax=Microvirga pudoricolor TaxID=2778729 RepID=UPI001950A009|nr:lysylphosphatidylglycerol synthase domain-containing protein [Microvirga pudoricolor]MBM6595860.1 UPF0104 family protein [Microvirga pudoricolor]